MKDEQKRFGKGFAVALAVHLVLAAGLGIFGYRFVHTPPEILEVSLESGGGGAHVHRGEYEVHLGGNPVDVCFRVEHHHVLGLPGHGDIQGPAATNGLLVGLARRAAAGRDGGQLKPGVVLQKGNEALTDHAGAADDANSVLFHNQYLRRSIISYSRSSLFETGKMRTFI